MNAYDFLTEASKWKQLIYDGKLSDKALKKLRKDANTLGKIDKYGRDFETHYARGVYNGALRKIRALRKKAGKSYKVIKDSHPSQSNGDPDKGRVTIPKLRRYGKNTPLVAAIIADHEANELRSYHKYKSKLVDILDNTKAGRALKKKYPGEYEMPTSVPKIGDKVTNKMFEPVSQAMYGAYAPHGHMPGVLSDEGKKIRMKMAITGKKKDPLLYVGSIPMHRSELEKSLYNISQKEEAKRREAAVKKLKKVLDKRGAANLVKNSKVRSAGMTSLASANKQQEKFQKKLERHPELISGFFNDMTDGIEDRAR